MERTINGTIVEKLGKTSALLTALIFEREERAKRKETARLRLEQGSPVDQTTVNYFDTELGNRIASFRATRRGQWTESDMQIVGQIVFDMMAPKLVASEGFALAKDGDVQLNKMHAEWNKNYDEAMRLKNASQRKGTAESNEAFREAANRANALAREYRKLEQQVESCAMECAMTARNMLLNTRPGTELSERDIKARLIENPRCKDAQLIVDALRAYPKEFIDGLMGKIGGAIVVDAKKKRGYFSWDGRRIAVGGRSATAFHELGHAMERACPVILELERQYFNKRTVGCKIERLRDVEKGAKYKPDEVTKKDSFLDSYMGKMYPNGRSYELVSMGFELFFTNPARLMKDEDYFKFICGILFSVTPSITPA